MRLSAPVTLPELEGMMRGWSRWRLLRRLRRLETKTGEAILVNVGGAGRHARWEVSLVALRRADPDLFDVAKTLPAEVADLKSRVANVEARLSESKVREKLIVSQVGRLAQNLVRKKPVEVRERR